MKTICLCMIVKNESKIIERAINSVKHLIDYWVIVDTGSSDNTKDLIYSALNGIPGELHDREWINFGHNRTESMHLSKDKSDYILLLDADETLIDEGFNKDSLTEDSYLIRFVGDNDYAKEKIVKSGLDWKWVGVTHEYLDSPDRKSRVESNNLKI